MEKSDPYSVSAHQGLLQRPLVAGVGIPLLTIIGIFLIPALLLHGLFSLEALASLGVAALLVWGARAWRRNDPYGAEALVADVTSPKRYEAQPRIDDPPHPPSRAIPKNP